MKTIKIRQGVFETNSSSTHSITICPKTDYDQFVEGKFLLNGKNELVPATDDNINTFESYEQWENDDELNTFVKSFTTKGGEELIAFGKYGYNG